MMKGCYYRCPVCKKKFPKLSAMNAHYRDVHPPLYCKTCEKEFVTPNGLEQHSYLHKAPKFKCSKCDQGFPFKSSLSSHLISHEMEKKHVCNYKNCEKSFFNRGDLVKHSKIHLEQTWSCSLCDYQSQDERNLKAHRRKHSNLKRYMCHTCTHLFKYHTQLKRHLPCTAVKLEAGTDEKEKKKWSRSSSPDY